MAKEEKTRKIVPVGSGLDNEKQELFCQEYVFGSNFGNATKAYGKVYGIDTTVVGSASYTVAVTSGSRLFTNANVRERISTLLNQWLSDAHVDAELAWVIRQKREISAKVAAIREYNRVKARVQEPGSIINILNVSAERLTTLAARAARIGSRDEPA